MQLYQDPEVSKTVANLQIYTVKTVKRRLLVEVKPIHFSLGGGKARRLISESGLYKLIMRSDKPQAKPFQDWVTKEVLPSIRKTGSYVTGQSSIVENPSMTPLELMMQQAQMLPQIIAQMMATNKAMEEQQKHKTRLSSHTPYDLSNRIKALSCVVPLYASSIA